MLIVNKKTTILIKKANRCLDTRDFKGALRYLNRALRFDPHYPEIYIKIAYIYSRLNDYENSLETYERAIQYVVNPNLRKVLNQKVEKLGSILRMGRSSASKGNISTDGIEKSNE
ncbi:MAG: tetratricopeptide repeat protein [Promethearchaeota archaeon]